MAVFDDDQTLVIEDCEGPRAVEAGPGSGKTTTMVGLINRLIDRGVSPSQIRALTFSKEMATTLEKRLRRTGIVSTFHSLGYLICSQIEHKPVEPELRYRLMVRLVEQFNLDYKQFDQFIAKMRRGNITPQEAVDCGEHDWGLARAYGLYETQRQQEGWMDFDSMLADAVKLLEKPEIRRNWQPKYLIVDEAQDTDDCQWRMMQLMAETYGNITVVGDPNQAIYGFRGAMPDNLTNFQKWFPEGRYFYLGKNYRSTQTIVKFVHDNAPADTPKELLDRMVPARSEKGARIGLKMYWTDELEAESALALAQKDPLHSVILARTNHLVGMLERLCNRHKIRYHLMGKTGFWKQTEIRKAVEALKNYPNLTTDAALGIVVPDLSKKYAVDDRTERDNDALENLQSLIEIGRDRDYKMARDFVAYATRMMHRRNDPNGVSISTVHQSKGGEWKNVYLIGANAKGIPHLKGDPKEEQRIYFVAISRAVDFLRISFSGTPSPYLRKYLTDEILDRLREHAQEFDSLEQQTKLFV